MELYQNLKENTLVDIYRCYELWSLAKQVANFEGSIVEIGSWRGGTAAILCLASDSSTRVYICDTFEGVVKAQKTIVKPLKAIVNHCKAL